ncbi:hypothetical protein L6164_006090 [Bauhinia variegata]|uniref:Uncharacterized protein n=1 Tax=Bauhinia variegata TaxID=167791 RepID=A0ACB9PTC6_BAUVA|nr:hypothetical protein L6164_006090 [Bauhinia variegata]
MRVDKSSVLLLFISFLVMLVILHLSSCRHLLWTSKEEMEDRARTRFLSSFPQASGTSNYYSAKSEDIKVKGIRSVSFTVTPGGPDPLHN